MKGKTNNPNGRPKGVQNKVTTALRNTVLAFLSNNIDDLQSNYDKLDPKDKLMFFEKLLKYVIPTNTYIREERESNEILINGIKFSEVAIIENKR